MSRAPRADSPPPRAMPQPARLRAFLPVIAAVLLALALSCSPAKRGEEIVFWQFWSSDVVTPLLQEFARVNPGLKERMEQLT